ncbi:MAG: hypothetical protein GKC09_05265 [Methanosarcinales archaeon]|nr:hypothetical protein [Methanosarcinales archaeon]
MHLRNSGCIGMRKAHFHIKGIKEETIVDWLRKASAHVEEIEALLLANYHLTRVQLDAMWTYVGHKGEKATILKRSIEAHSGEVPR